MRVDRIGHGLWRWTGAHPDWEPGQTWDQEVGCVYAELDDAIVLVDPLIPPEERERFLEFLDRDVERLARPVAILLTTRSHTRSSDELAARYSAVVGQAPASVETLDTGWPGERAYWLPRHAALVTGDLFRGGDLSRDWIGDNLAAVQETLARWLELPIEHLLPAHGEPVLGDARAVLAEAAQND